MGSSSDKCDVCGLISDNIVAGRWIFHCPEHAEVDRQKTYDNEIATESDYSDLEYEVAELLI